MISKPRDTGTQCAKGSEHSATTVVIHATLRGTKIRQINDESHRNTKAHSYRRACFPKFQTFGNNWAYVSICGGVLPLFVKFSRSKNIKVANIPIFGKTKQENMEG